MRSHIELTEEGRTDTTHLVPVAGMHVFCARSRDGRGYTQVSWPGVNGEKLLVRETSAQILAAIERKA